MNDLFNLEDNGAEFSECRKYRFALWRIWDKSKPLVMFIGLNPSTANEDTDDPTIQSVIRIAKNNGYGGIYMMNCFSYISTDPDKLYDCSGWIENEKHLKEIASKCNEVVFAWGNFKVVQKLGVDYLLFRMFPNAKCIMKNKNGSPGHPLFKKGITRLINFK